MAGFRRGAEAIQAAATRSGGGGFTPTHKFEAGEVKYLQFLTAIEDVFTVSMHRFVIVGEREDGSPIYKDFISRKDVTLDGSDGYDPLIDRFGLKPSDRSIAIAVELKPVFSGGAKKKIEGWEIVEREFTDKEGEDHTVPNIALVCESPFTFFNHLTAFADLKPIESVIFAVKRTGKSTDTTYTFMEADTALEGADELYEEFTEEFDLEAYLEDLADVDRIKEFIDPLEDDAVVSRYGGKKREEKKKTTNKSSSSRSRTTKARDEEPEESDESDSDDAGEGDEEPVDRKRSFAALRRTTAGK